MATQHIASAPVDRPRPKFQIEIYRDGKSSESVSFVSAFAETGHHHSVAAVDTDSTAAAKDHNPEGAPSSDTSASNDDGTAAQVSSPKTAAALPPSETVPADESASFAPKGRTIDIP